MCCRKATVCLFLSVTMFVVSLPEEENHRLMNPGNLNSLCSLADKISEAIDNNPKFRGKQQVLVSLGQTPAYLLKAIDCADTVKGRTDRQYKHVAFSGDLYGERTKEPTTAFFTAESCYKNYLGRMGLSKKNLYNTDAEVIIIEACATGLGLISFLHFFKKYKKFPNVIYLQIQSLSLNRIENVPLEIQKNMQKFALKHSTEDCKIITILDDNDDNDSRIVPHFEWTKWRGVDPLAFKLGNTAQEIISKIEQFSAFKHRIMEHLHLFGLGNYVYLDGNCEKQT